MPLSLQGNDDDDTILAKDSFPETINGGNGNDRADVDTTDTVSNVEFFDTNYIKGIVFNDVNSNGIQDATETSISGRTVFIDVNNSGVYDVGDKQTTTNANGYAFTALTPGTYTLRQILPSGWVQTTPANDGPITVTLVAGTPQTGKNFGTMFPQVQSPFFGSPFFVPFNTTTIIQAEDFDNGGEGLAYHDTTAGNQGSTIARAKAWTSPQSPRADLVSDRTQSVNGLNMQSTWLRERMT